MSFQFNERALAQAIQSYKMPANRLTKILRYMFQSKLLQAHSLKDWTMYVCIGTASEKYDDIEFRTRGVLGKRTNCRCLYVNR
jgi:hypothetical protein